MLENEQQFRAITEDNETRDRKKETVKNPSPDLNKPIPGLKGFLTKKG